MTLHELDNQLKFEWTNPDHYQDVSWYGDGISAIIVAMCRANYGDGFDPVLVTLKHEKPACAGDFFEYFRCPVEFSAKQDSVVLSLETVDKRLSGSNPLLAQVHDQMMVEYLVKLDENDIIQRVKATIVKLLPDGNISDVKIAKELYMGSRTLQRKLQGKETTFNKILTEVRKEMALKYLQDSQLTLTELSFQLGFSEMSSFSRAFKGWTGQSPNAFRQSV